MSESRQNSQILNTQVRGGKIEHPRKTLVCFMLIITIMLLRFNFILLKIAFGSFSDPFFFSFVNLFREFLGVENYSFFFSFPPPVYLKNAF